MHLCNLKSLKWMIGKYDVIPWEVEETLAKVFEHFEVKPKIEVKGWVYNLSRWPLGSDGEHGLGCGLKVVSIL